MRPPKRNWPRPKGHSVSIQREVAQQLCVKIPAILDLFGPDSAMASKRQRIEVTLETRLDSVTVAENICARAAESAGFCEDDCYKLSLAVREGVVNALRYGNEEQCHKKIHVSFAVENGKFVVCIADQGRGFDPSSLPDPLADDNLLKTSGRGVFLMRTIMDEWDVERSDSGAEVVMAKRLPASGNRTRSPRGG